MPLPIERQEAALAKFATGVCVAAHAVTPPDSLCSTTKRRRSPAWTCQRSERCVMRLVGGSCGGVTRVLIARTDGRRVAGRVEHEDATRLVVTLEDGT